MASPTEEDIQKKQKEVEALKEEVAKSDARRNEGTDARTREVKAQRLAREEERLRLRLERNKRAEQAGTRKQTSTASSTPPPSQSGTGSTGSTGNDDNKE